MLVLHRFMAAISRAALNHDDGGGSGVDAIVWDHASGPNARKVVSRLIEDLAVMPGPPQFLDNTWRTVDLGPVTDGDLGNWPYSLGILLEFTAFLPSLH